MPSKGTLVFEEHTTMAFSATLTDKDKLPYTGAKMILVVTGDKAREQVAFKIDSDGSEINESIVPGTFNVVLSEAHADQLESGSYYFDIFSEKGGVRSLHIFGAITVQQTGNPA